MDTIGMRFQALREASGYSMAKVASIGGWANASSVQKFFEPSYNPECGVRPSIIRKLALSLGDGVYEVASSAKRREDTSLASLLSLLRNDHIPYDVRVQAASERVRVMLED